MELHVTTVLPRLAVYPKSEYRTKLKDSEWKICVQAWIRACKAIQSCENEEFTQVYAKLVKDFLCSYFSQQTLHILLNQRIDSQKNSISLELTKYTLQLAQRCLSVHPIPEYVTQWDFFACVATCHSNNAQLSRLLDNMWTHYEPQITRELDRVLSQLIHQLQHHDEEPAKLNLLHVASICRVCPCLGQHFFLGTNLIDTITTEYTAYSEHLCQICSLSLYYGLLALVKPTVHKYTNLCENLFILKLTAQKDEPVNLARDFLGQTDVLQIIQATITNYTKSIPSRLASLVEDLNAYRVAHADAYEPANLGHADQSKLTLIHKIQEMFPNHSDDYLNEVLAYYDNSLDKSITALVDGNVPPHITTACQSKNNRTPDRVKHRIYATDGTTFDARHMNANNTQLGKSNPSHYQNAHQDDQHQDLKSAILRALETINLDDEDDDEDDDYNHIATKYILGRTVANNEGDHRYIEEALYSAWQVCEKLFERDGPTRKSYERDELRKNTGLTDEEIEEWGSLMRRNSGQERNLQNNLSGPANNHKIARDASRDVTNEKAQRVFREDQHGWAPGRSRGRGRGRGRSNGEQGRSYQKGGSRGANHDRRNNRAKKMMQRGSFGK